MGNVSWLPAFLAAWSPDFLSALPEHIFCSGRQHNRTPMFKNLQPLLPYMRRYWARLSVGLYLHLLANAIWCSSPGSSASPSTTSPSAYLEQDLRLCRPC